MVKTIQNKKLNLMKIFLESYNSRQVEISGNSFSINSEIQIKQDEYDENIFIISGSEVEVNDFKAYIIKGLTR